MASPGAISAAGLGRLGHDDDDFIGDRRRLGDENDRLLGDHHRLAGKGVIGGKLINRVILAGRLVAKLGEAHALQALLKP